MISAGFLFQSSKMFYCRKPGTTLPKKHAARCHGYHPCCLIRRAVVRQFFLLQPTGRTDVVRRCYETMSLWQRYGNGLTGCLKNVAFPTACKGCGKCFDFDFFRGKSNEFTVGQARSFLLFPVCHRVDGRLSYKFPILRRDQHELPAVSSIGSLIFAVSPINKRPGSA